MLTIIVYMNILFWISSIDDCLVDSYIVILLICKSYSFGTTLSPAQMEFNVKFSGEPVVSDSNKVVASILDSNNALINVYDLTMEDNKKSITFIVILSFRPWQFHFLW